MQFAVTSRGATVATERPRELPGSAAPGHHVRRRRAPAVRLRPVRHGRTIRAVPARRRGAGRSHGPDDGAAVQYAGPDVAAPAGTRHRRGAAPPPVGLRPRGRLALRRAGVGGRGAVAGPRERDRAAPGTAPRRAPALPAAPVPPLLPDAARTTALARWI